MSQDRVDTNISLLQYPIGRFNWEQETGPDEIPVLVKSIEQLPALLRAAVQNMDEDQLNTPYRPEGWTVRQVVHHLPDSHINSYIRFKWALTEDTPVIKTYMEDKWAELSDAKETDVEISLRLLEALHIRWILMLKSLSKNDLKRTFVNPESGRVISLAQAIALYAWHGQHHLAHIQRLKERMGWLF